MKYKEIKETATILRRKITVSNKKIEELENEYKHHATIYNYLSHKLEVKEEELDSYSKNGDLMPGFNANGVRLPMIEPTAPVT